MNILFVREREKRGKKRSREKNRFDQMVSDAEIFPRNASRIMIIVDKLTERFARVINIT